MKLVGMNELVANSRLYADLRGADANNGFVNSVEIERLINLAFAEFYDLLVSARGQEYYLTFTELTATPGQSTIELPEDFYQLYSVHAQWGAYRELLEPLDSLKEVHRFNNMPWGQGSPKRYRIQTSKIEFFPTPTTEQMFDVRYLPVYPTLNESGFDGINGWDRLVALRVAIDIRALNDKSTAQLQALYQQERDRIEELAAQRDAGTPTRIRDVTVSDDPWPYGHGWPG